MSQSTSELLHLQCATYHIKMVDWQTDEQIGSFYGSAMVQMKLEQDAKSVTKKVIVTDQKKSEIDLLSVKRIRCLATNRLQRTRISSCRAWI